MSSITDLLAAILAAKKGEEVRGSIHDAIELCYQDGKAGVNDLQARQLIEAVAEVNEQQAAALEVLQARVEELESGEGGSSQQSTTIDIPTVLVDGGVVESLNVNNNGVTTHHITFTTAFTEAPRVMVAIGKNAGAVSQYGYLSANILYPTITTTGFDFFLANRTGSDRSPGVVWYAYQPTVRTIDLDITIPDAQGMSEADVRAITGPISAAVDAIKTGYDGTTYQTAAEAVRTQINDLHVLIGDEPGTAISADSIGYGEGSVADELTGLNERLTEYTGNSVVSGWTDGNYIATNGETVDVSALVSNNSYRCVVIPVSAGDVFTLNCAGGDIPRAWCVVNSSYTVLDVSGRQVSVSDYVLTIPENGAYLILNDNSDGSSYHGELSRIKLENVIDETNELHDKTANLKGRVDTLSGMAPVEMQTGYIKLNLSVGSTVSLTPKAATGNYAGYKYAVVDCSEGDQFIINSTGTAEGRPYGVVDSNNALLSVANAGTVNGLKFTCPANAAKLIINNSTNTVSYAGHDRIESIEDDVDELALADAEIKSSYDALPEQYVGNWGNSEFFAGAKISDILKFEKLSCIHHDNFHRANNTSDIGYNGTSEVPMGYTSVNTSPGAQLNVGINNNKAVFTNPSSVAASAVAMRIIDPEVLPYKITVSADAMASIAVGVIDATQYVRIVVKPNIITITPTNTTQAESATITHNIGLCNAEIYVFKDKIVCCVAGKEVLRTAANMTSTKCGLHFRAGDTTTAFNMFNVFFFDKFENNKLDEIVERTETTTSRQFGIVQTGNANGVRRDTEIVNFSGKSLKFYLTPNDDDANNSKRSELVPVDPKTAYHNLQSKLFDFDVYFPDNYDDEVTSEIFLQMHDRPDGVNEEGLHPGIEFETKSGKMLLCIRGTGSKVAVGEKELVTRTDYDLGAIPKGQWTHFTVYMREGYMAEHYPVVAVWINGELKVVSRLLNTYNELYGSYLKFGMYKPAWKTAPTTVNSRTIYFDNFVVWQ